jgi:hypothetical protein
VQKTIRKILEEVDEDPNLGPISSFTQSLAVAKRVRDEAAMAVCPMCADGWLVKCGDLELPSFWYHPSDALRGGAQICQASSIYKLLGMGE